MNHKVFLSEQNLKIELVKINEILSILVPSFIKNLMYKGKIIISEDQGDVAILFCDICDFDKIVFEERQRLINFLDSIFRAFDKFCFNYKVQKIETVGKTYMACAGLKEYEYSNLIDVKTSKNSTTRILELALEMIRHVQKYKWGKPAKDLTIKIGIHYGSVLAGVIGFHKPQFSLIGDTVNTTSRVCSTGDSGKITISEAAYKQLRLKEYEQKIHFVQKSVEAKGKGNMITYQLEIKSSSDDQINFNKKFSQTSPKHSFFLSPTNKEKRKSGITNYGFSDVMKDDQDSVRKNQTNSRKDSFQIKSFLSSSDEIHSKILKSDDEVKETFFNSSKLLSNENNIMIVQENSSIKNPEIKSTRQVSFSKEYLFSLNDEKFKNSNNSKKLGSFSNLSRISETEKYILKKKKTFPDLNHFCINKRNTSEIMFSSLKETTPSQKQISLQALKQEIIYIHNIHKESKNSRKLNNRTSMKSTPIRKISSQSICIHISDCDQQNLVIPNFANAMNNFNLENPINEPSCIDLKKVSVEINMQNSTIEKSEQTLIPKKLNTLKSITAMMMSSETDKIEEFYEYEEKKPQPSKNSNLCSKNSQEEKPIHYENLKDDEGEVLFLKSHKIWLYFPQEVKDLAGVFWKNLDKKTLKRDRFIVWFLIIICFIITFIKILLIDKYLYLSAFIISNVFVLFVMVLLICFDHKIHKFKLTHYTYFCFLLIILILMVNEAYNSQNDMYLPKLTLMLIYCGLSEINRMNFIETIVLTLTYILFDAFYTYISYYENHFQLLLISFGLGSWIIGRKHMKLRMEIDLFNKERGLEYEKTRLNQLIRYLLPPHVII